jgi:hypothetical protein
MCWILVIVFTVAGAGLLLALDERVKKKTGGSLSWASLLLVFWVGGVGPALGFNLLRDAGISCESSLGGTSCGVVDGRRGTIDCDQ